MAEGTAVAVASPVTATTAETATETVAKTETTASAATVTADAKGETVKPAVEETVEADIEAIKAEYKKTLDAQYQTEMTAAKSSSYEDGIKATSDRLKAVIGVCNNDYATAMQLFDKGMDVGKATEAYAKHLTEMAAKRIPVGINDAARANALSIIAKANQGNFFDKWKFAK